jgi:hypothetical protein
MGKTFLTCAGISVGTTVLQSPDSSQLLQNKVLLSFRIVTAVTQHLLLKREESWASAFLITFRHRGRMVRTLLNLRVVSDVCKPALGAQEGMRPVSTIPRRALSRERRAEIPKAWRSRSHQMATDTGSRGLVTSKVHFPRSDLTG